ncbi:MAG: hypothetical protein APU95_00725 [Hadesarchaea archaeon YNP_N21]|nr:MAG: hypothetical protein APU95_00725 [Hadesarchaea archaeon YNP_N21]
MGWLDGPREGIHDPESGGEGVLGPIQTDEALAVHRSPPAEEGDGTYVDEARKDGGLPHPTSRFMSSARWHNRGKR